jgi:hypothetical protein
VADQYGPTPLPLPVPGATGVLSDPALQYLLEYLQAVMPIQAETAWLSVAPAEPLVRTVFPWDPEKEGFDDQALPSAYAWRDEMPAPPVNNEWTPVTDSVSAIECQIIILWVFPTAAPDVMQRLHPFIRGFAIALRKALTLGRHPAWVVTGDPDSSAASMGSVLPRWCGWSKYQLGAVTRAEVNCENVDNTEVVTFPALRAELQVAEEFTTDPAIVPGGDPMGRAWPNRKWVDINRTDNVVQTSFQDPVPDQ